MSRLSKKLRDWFDPKTGRRGVSYWCQGCKSVHAVCTSGEKSWQWNHDVDKPSFFPSVDIEIAAQEEKEGQPAIPYQRCHTFITEGMVQFQGDCTHEFVGQTVPLPDLPPHLR